MEKSKEKIKSSIKEKILLMNTPLMSILPGQISFFVILSILPLISVIAMIITKLSFSMTSITNFVANYFPSGASNIILAIIGQQRVGAFDVFFVITAFFLAAKATHSIVVASTTIYAGKQKDFIRTRIKAIVILIVLIFLVIFMFAALSGGKHLILYLSQIFPGTITKSVYLVYSILKWPVVFFMVFMVIKVIYTMAPNVKIPSNSVNKGALSTTVIWTISTFIYSFYASNLANYNKFYGNLSNLIILMIWIYWLSYIFVFGMTMNEYKFANKKIKE
ncbi:MAG: YihY/virulence factor BrkB family protein [Bacilli bacterium]